MDKLRITKYSKWYFSLINYRSKNLPTGYTEKHHIIPKSLGGLDNLDNIVRLTAREHYIAHLLLTKMFPYDYIKTAKMVRAWCAMAWFVGDTQERLYKINSRTFNALRELFAKIMSDCQTGSNNSQYSTVWVHNKRLKQNKKVNINQSLEEGWQYGRIIKNWDIQEKNINKIKVCKNCNKQYKNRMHISAFCSAKCGRNYEYHKNSIWVEIQREDKTKKIKRQDYGAYKKYGWQKVG